MHLSFLIGDSLGYLSCKNNSLGPLKIFRTAFDAFFKTDLNFLKFIRNLFEVLELDLRLPYVFENLVGDVKRNLTPSEPIGYVVEVRKTDWNLSIRAQLTVNSSLSDAKRYELVFRLLRTTGWIKGSQSQEVWIGLLNPLVPVVVQMIEVEFQPWNRPNLFFSGYNSCEPLVLYVAGVNYHSWPNLVEGVEKSGGRLLNAFFFFENLSLVNSFVKIELICSFRNEVEVGC